MEGRRRVVRSSIRSKSSRGSSSLSDVDTREKIKDCCRKTVAFMCSKVGVIGLVVGYTLIGAVSFMKIELLGKDTNYVNATNLRKEYAIKLWTVARVNNVFNETLFSNGTDKVLKNFQQTFVEIVKDGYDGRTLKTIWTFPGALMFSLSTITMVGYGNIVPKTVWGKIATAAYAIIGIPLYVLYFLNIGKGLSEGFKWVYVWLVQCSSQTDENDPPRRIIVPSTACLWVIGGYVLIGTIMFAEWEKWSYLDSSYFCITSLCKLGFGDLVPGNIATKSGSQFRLVMNYFYLLFGQGLVAMCFHLMREEVRIKVNEVKEDLTQCLKDTHVRFTTCYEHRCKTHNAESY